ncbi:MAG: glycosyltransferase [Flavobacterium sp.]|nr:glycosyltransferase [Flavobacterium sp.]
MKKNIVFVIPSLSAGGAEKSLVNLLNTIDFDRYNVDLILFKQGGIFQSMVPKEVTILNLGTNYSIFAKRLLSSSFHFLFSLKFLLFWNRIIFSFKNIEKNNISVTEQKSWKNFRTSLPDFNKKYDAAIGFLEKSSIYCVIDKIQAKNKLGWIHTNYSSSGMDINFDRYYFNKLNAIITVSPECKNNLCDNFPEYHSKIKIIYNVVSESIIKKLSSQTIVNNSLIFNNSLLTIARFSTEKGCDLAIEAAKILHENAIDFKWIFIGDGTMKDFILNKIDDYNLEQNVFLIGLKQNPYPYIKECTIYVQPSRYEGKSMAVEEAKILGKPVIVTNFDSAKDQIESFKTGIIAEMNPKSIADEITKLLQNKDLQNQISTNLSKNSYGTESEINKLYDLINE